MQGVTALVLVACVAGSSVARTVTGEPRIPHASGHASKKERVDDRPSLPLLGTLVQIHTGTLLPLDASLPGDERFVALMADRVTGKSEPIDPRLLELVRRLAARHVGARIELVSGYRSAKLNEMLRKKGHHVASHSQHSLGHALDFRLVLPGESDPMPPSALEAEIRSLGWDGGVGVYPGKDDRFVHADVGPRRGWTGE